MMELDHLLWAAPDLEEGTRTIEALTGVRPTGGGSHAGFGTRNNLMGLTGGIYFEVISPDPAQTITGNRGGRIAAMPHAAFQTFAMRATELDKVKAAAERLGLTCEGPVSMSRVRPDGVKLSWSILYLRHPTLGEAIPFAIDWRDSPHPSQSLPAECSLKSLIALQPDPSELARIYQGLNVPIEVKRSPRAGFIAVLDTPRGEVVLPSL